MSNLFKMSSEARCKLNSDSSVCLQDILESFHSPVREEHAWALCYQSCKFYEGLLGTNNHENYLSLTTLDHLFLQTDGNIHPNTLFGGSNATAGASRKKLNDEQHFIKGLGLVIYQTLDHHSNVGEEMAIRGDLESLIAGMISNERNVSEVHHETEDEGIEKNSEEGEDLAESSKRTIRHVMRMCEKHLPVLTKPQVEAHYKAVVHALVTESPELSSFLEKVAKEKCYENSADLEQLQLADWARFWMQVVAELRMGVKPLKKASDLKLPPPIRTFTLREQLMNSIRNGRQLRPVKKGPTCEFIQFDFSQLQYEDDDDEPMASNNSDGEPRSHKLIAVQEIFTQML